ncbi:flagellar basal body-associated FliL family protein [Campylobacter sp. MIT 97-5078]|uniref:flagellar basal body-associated FliL family protein n=1 Tax=Campylobacter sp. MIT 97-5078 TaxID=1548153 RepID=UPI000690B9BB|nr:flagellar basal body-associated FliL family protein [Campylobacter sp. MIT 97-5078]TQR28009.1 hypothetical protein DMB91_01900 [Campylobacter sp. MIT 97-5078]
MKKIILFLLLPLFVLSQSLKVENLRTEIYSKAGKNTLKKVQISLEFEGKNVKENESKITDASNIIISSFFYEDLFTELGKLRFKDTLQNFINKKYKLEIDGVYILALKGIEKFDIEELKSFLKDTEASDEQKETAEKIIKKDEEKNTSTFDLKVPEIKALSDPSSLLVPDTDTQSLNVDTIDPKALELPSYEALPKTLQLKDKNISLDSNQSF